MNSSVLSTGAIGIVLVLAISAACIAPFGHHVFVDWVATAFMAATPAQVILGLLWHNNKPEVVARLSQPYKGIALTTISILTGAVVLGLVMLLVGGGHGPTPMVIQYFIMTIVVVVWMIPVWQCWPLNLLSNNPVVIGCLTFIFSYLLAYVLWRVFFDYSVLGSMGHPHYYEDIDPKGLIDLWTAIIFFVTCVSVIIVHMLLEFWPVNKLAGNAVQPLRGIIATLYVLVVATIIRTLFIDGLGMQPVDYMIRVPVCMIFGTFLVNNMMQFSLFPSAKQPVRGLLLILSAAVVAVITYELYRWASTLHTGSELGAGPSNGFAQELWIASAMLGVTFPIIFVVSGFFGFWPIVRKPTEVTGETEAQA
jgi:hypothetical protein